MSKELKEKFNNVVHEYCKAFCYKHGFEEYDENNWMSGDVGGLLEIGDYIIDFDEIRKDIDDNIAVGVFEEWYSYDYELAVMGISQKVNYKSWCMGYRPYTDNQIIEIRDAHKRMTEAKNAFDKLLHEIK